MLTSWVGSVGSGRELGVSAVGGRAGVGVGDDVEQLANTIVVINNTYMLLIMISMNKYT